ncbi:MAG: hypothetical protein KKC18_05300, partial [Chloroflexi bacterium]|nr:hypothetical protein [Chloroflexota bacterium]
PVKLATEQARLLLTFDTQARDQLLTELAEERRAEVLAILEAGRRVSVRFAGSLESFDDAAWIVSELQVTLDANTLIEGIPVVGATVAVEGLAPGDGSLLAVRLSVDGTGKAPEPTVTYTPTITPQPTVTPTLTPSPRETYTPYPTKTPEPTYTPHPTETLEPEPTNTPYPTETLESEPTHTPHPMETHEPEPTHTPYPTETLEPTHTPHMTETPHH